MCQEIVDLSTGKLVTKKNCEQKDGSIVVITKGDLKVDIHDAPKDFDLSGVISAAIGGDAGAVQKAADAAGAKASDPQPSGNQTTKL
jgi:hypothetical protein